MESITWEVLAKLAIFLMVVAFLYWVFRTKSPGCPVPECGCWESDQLGPDMTGRRRYQCWACHHVWAVDDCQPADPARTIKMN